MNDALAGDFSRRRFYNYNILEEEGRKKERLKPVNIDELVRFHKEQKFIATLTAVQEPGRFGSFTLGEDQTKVSHFREKVKDHDSAWINGGYFVLEPTIFDHIDNDSSAIFFAVIPGRTLGRDGVALKYPVAKLTSDRKDFPEKAGIDQVLEFE